jgi:aspartate-semialdehyde dehydrogenase
MLDKEQETEEWVVEVKEYNQVDVVVEARNEYHAEEIVNDMLNMGNVVFDDTSGHFETRAMHKV